MNVMDWLKEHFSVVAALVAVDIVTLIITVIIALNQGAATQDAINKGCQNSGALIATDQRQIAGFDHQLEQQTPALYHSFLPGLDEAHVTLLIKKQTKVLSRSKAQAQAEIDSLSMGCTKDQLNLDPST